MKPGDPYPLVDPLKCEGCKVCVHFCPAGAIDFVSIHCGTWFVSDTRFGPMVHAQLFPAEENSGRLVALLRQKAQQIAQDRDHQLIISDGPPGIGCPVISAMAGVRLAVIVTEPTPPGRHDLERVLALCDHFKVTAAVIINKCDLNRAVAARIRADCRQRGLPVVAELPHEALFVQAMIQGQTVTEFSHGALRRQIEQAWDHIGRQASADSRRQRPADARSVA